MNAIVKRLLRELADAERESREALRVLGGGCDDPDCEGKPDVLCWNCVSRMEPGERMEEELYADAIAFSGTLDAWYLGIVAADQPKVREFILEWT